MDRPEALILFSHGSVLCGAGEAIAAHAARLQATGRFQRVEIGYLNYSSPSFADAVDVCYGAGYRRIIVVPFFLVPGYFVSTALPRQIKKTEERYPDLDFAVASPIGYDELLADAMIDAARNAVGPDGWDAEVRSASAHCARSPECPLYGTASCPETADCTGATA